MTSSGVLWIQTDVFGVLKLTLQIDFVSGKLGDICRQQSSTFNVFRNLSIFVPLVLKYLNLQERKWFDHKSIVSSVEHHSWVIKYKLDYSRDRN